MIIFFKFPLVETLGGAEFHTLKLAQYFQSAGRPIKLFTSDRKLLTLFVRRHLSAEYVFAGWEPTSRWSLLLWPLTYLIAAQKAKQLLKFIPAGSVFFMQSLTEKLALTPISYKLKARLVWLEHKIPGRWLKLNPLLKRYLSLSKRVRLVTVSNFAKQAFMKLGVPAENIEVIYPGVTPRSYNPKPKSAFVIGFLGRLHLEKGAFDFVKLIIPHIRNHPNWQVLIGGDGQDEQRIANIVTDSNLEEQFQLLGLVSDLDQFFARISVLVYPSAVPESFGLSALEALTRGIPVIASNIGALPEFIKHGGNGYLVNREGEWGEYLEKLEEPNWYDELARGAAVSAKNFSDKKFFHAFEALIKNDK